MGFPALGRGRLSGGHAESPGAAYESIAADLGIDGNTLRNRVLRDRERRGVGPEAARDTGTAVRPTQAMPSAEPDERIRQFEARVAEFEASERKPATERTVRREAAKYSAGETNQ
ncbi:hypothetical protein GCM10017779_67890 [Streptomyces capillispiralis]|uniref:Uncharacterized protein n=1 Tax=Streptomyces capillispiralis TaxID=68182 RepID=A0A561SGJ0_9ACTN|nr:hypothetical protein FHX78_1211 [Streptomyces capillispiralis]GHH96332.1 hypothetical protein GCM10017779_67890 [Streptomyces capillispiralis]